MTDKIPVYEDIIKAHERILPFVHRTPVLFSTGINNILGIHLYFKCENFQKVGAFKFRGATNAVRQLSSAEAKKGVTTHSSGNHAAALSLAARQMDIPAYIVMPENAPDIKKKAVKGYGAEITFCESTLEAREKTLEIVQQKTGATFIHPYHNFNVICGQGTAAKEFLEDYPDLDVIIAPVGGGGLMSGTSIAAKAIKKGIKVMGAEPLNADDAYRSFKQGELIPSLKPNTIADGLLTSLSPLTFQIIRENVDDILTVKEETIIEAMQLIWERMKIIIEPSSAVPLAAVIENNKLFKGRKVGIIISGGNVDLNHLPF
ncbi:MAG: pyridoxal-phosphate dependent enzyme [Bacteroidales bacterium]